jgi:hypothetical protein
MLEKKVERKKYFCKTKNFLNGALFQPHFGQINIMKN